MATARELMKVPKTVLFDLELNAMHLRLASLFVERPGIDWDEAAQQLSTSRKYVQKLERDLRGRGHLLVMRTLDGAGEHVQREFRTPLAEAS